MASIKHDVWEDNEGASLCFSGELGEENRTLLGKDAKIIFSFYADSHFNAMTQYYKYMGYGVYTTMYEIDKIPYDLKELEARAKIRGIIDKILWEDWDPISVNDIAPRDEYWDYVPAIVGLVLQGASTEEVSNKLFYFETDTMGVNVNGTKEHCNAIAVKIMQECTKYLIEPR